MQIRPLLGLLGVLIAAFAAEFNDQVASAAITDVAGGLHISHDPATWFDSLYVSAEVLGMALAPWLLVTFTLRHFALYVLVLNVVSSLLIPVCPVEPALYALRCLQGLSGGLTIPLLMTTALRVLDPPIRLYGLAVYSLTASFTPALATSMAALWTDLVGWQFVFLQALPLCAVAAVLVWHGVPQDAPRYDRFRIFDWRGFLGVLVGLGSLSTMLQQGDRLDWFNSPLICVLALLSVVVVPLLLLNEWFHPLPLIKLQLLGRRNIAFGGLALFMFLLIGQSGSGLPNSFLQEVQGFRPEQAYLVTLEVAVSQLLMLPLLAWVLDHRAVDARVVNFLGLGLVLVSCVGSSFLTVDWFPGEFFLWQAFQAVGQPMVVMSLLLLATNAVRGPAEAPFASALVNTPRALAEATGVWLTQLITRWRGGLHYNRIADQLGQDRWRLPGAGGAGPGGMAALSQAVEAQARVLTISDAFLVFAAITVALMLVVLVLPERTLPPRLQLAKG